MLFALCKHTYEQLFLVLGLFVDMQVVNQWSWFYVVADPSDGDLYYSVANCRPGA